MKKRAVSYVVRVSVQHVLGLTFYLAGAGGKLGPRALIYFCMYFIVTAVSMAVMLRHNPETLAERDKTNTNSPLWDKILLGVYWLIAFFVVYLVAGLEAKNAPAIGWAFWLGMLLTLASSALSLYALTVNTFLESTARVQTDRGQTVCREGPYRVVRHPTYAAALLFSAALPLVFGTPLVGGSAVVIAAVIVVRTIKEDKMLIESLTGYAEYAAETRYRLVPFVW